MNAWDDPYLSRETYWVAQPGDFNGAIKIFYALGYHRDGGVPGTAGFSAHAGDSEFIILQVYWHTDRWALHEVFLSAHWGAVTHSSERVFFPYVEFPDGVFRGRPLVYVAKYKHANYKSFSTCDWGASTWDTCDGGGSNLSDPWFAVEVRPTGNMGSFLWPMVPSPVYSISTTHAGLEYLWSTNPNEKFYGWNLPRSGDGAYTYGIPLWHMGFAN